MNDKTAEIIYQLKRSATALDYLSMVAEERTLDDPDVKGHCFILDMISDKLKRAAFDLGEDDHIVTL